MILVPERGEESSGESILARAFLPIDGQQGFLHLDSGERSHQRRVHAGMNNGRGVPPHLLTATFGAGGGLLLLKKSPVEVGGHPHDLILA